MPETTEQFVIRRRKELLKEHSDLTAKLAPISKELLQNAEMAKVLKIPDEVLNGAVQAGSTKSEQDAGQVAHRLSAIISNNPGLSTAAIATTYQRKHGELLSAASVGRKLKALLAEGKFALPEWQDRMVSPDIASAVTSFPSAVFGRLTHVWG